MTFHFTVELGNDAMQSGKDVADALRIAADELADYDLPFTANDCVPVCSAQGIFDANGNMVGMYELRLGEK